MATLQHRLVIPGTGSTFAPGDADPLSDDDFYITSKRRTDHPWIADDGEGRPDLQVDGQRLDVLTGAVEDGEVQIRVIDVASPVVACDVNSILLAEGSPGDLGLDANAFTTGGWVRETSESDTAWAPYTWWGANASGPLLGGSALFFWVDDPGGPPYQLGNWVRASWIKKTFNGTEQGGAAWTPGQKLGFRFRINWTLDTGGGNIFVEVNGTRVSGLTSSFDFWNMPVDSLNNQVDTVVWAAADGSGEVEVKMGGENYYPSCNVSCQFTDIEVVQCADVAGPGDDLYVTGWLADDDARQQLLGRQAYLEESTDGGTAWSRVVYTGYVRQITLEASLSYVFTLGDAGRGRRVGPAWRNLNPVEDFTP